MHVLHILFLLVLHVLVMSFISAEIAIYFILIIIFLFFVMMFSNVKETYRIMNYSDLISIEEVNNQAKTGDLIGFKHKDTEKIYGQVFPFSHVGVIVRNPTTNEKITVESHANRDTEHMNIYGGGIKIYDLRKRLQQYQGKIFYIRSNVDEPTMETTMKFLALIPKWQQTFVFPENIKLDYINECAANRMLGMKVHEPKDRNNRINCSDFIAECLKELKMIDKHLDTRCILPSDFINLVHHNKYLYNDHVYKIIV